jgi:hypothetical protein
LQFPILTYTVPRHLRSTSGLRSLLPRITASLPPGLNRLLASSVVWNTVHLQACLRRLRADGQPIDDTDLRFLSPLLQGHLGIYGQYRFDVEQYGAAASPATLTY